jgi:outer membrane protein OmpA-like peptidoglycan-associated protein
MLQQGGGLSQIAHLTAFAALCCLCAPCRTIAQNKSPNLSGVWYFGAFSGPPNVRFTQNGAAVKSVFIAVDPETQEKWGFVVGDANLSASISDHTIRGKVNSHHPVVPFKANCPDVWDFWTDVELTLSPDANTLEGRWKNLTHDEKTCKLIKEEWQAIRYIRPAPTVTQEGDRIRVSLPGGILFDFDKYSLKPDAQRVLSQVLSDVIDKHSGAKLVVEGHTDNVGTDQHNQNLSVDRAQSVASWLKEHGVKASRISVVGWGKNQPHYPNDTEEHRYRNRRVEILVLTGNG